MPFFYFVGKETHVGDYFNGLNATLMASYLNIALEARPDFIDFKGSEVFSPPTCLKLKDLRDAYSVTLPERAVAYYNLLTVSKSPAQILESMKRAAAEAFSMAVDHLRKTAASYSKKSGQDIGISWQTKVITYGELEEKVCRNFPGNMSEHVKHYIASLPESLDERDKAISLVGELLKYYPDKAPMIIVGFLPPYYPHRGNLGRTEEEKNVMKAVDKVIEEARQSYGIEMKVVEYFAGITDLSYFGFQGKAEELKALSDNMPGWREIYDIPLNELAKLDIPVLNLGPSGKDDHKYTERLELSYSLNITPRLLKFAVESLAKS
jgi:arginine utilization protein RocB